MDAQDYPSYGRKLASMQLVHLHSLVVECPKGPKALLIFRAKSICFDVRTGVQQPGKILHFGVQLKFEAA